MAELTFDVIFIDCGNALPYDRKSLENKPMGGVESSVIRVAEGLGALGLTVGVIKASDPEAGIVVHEFEPIMGQYVFYMHEKELPRIATRFSVLLRGPLYLNAFNERVNGLKTKKFVWLHDLAAPEMKAWIPLLKEHEATIVGVSKWHKQNIKDNLDYNLVTYAYNPLPDEVYKSQEPRKINKNLMVWASSPHKGLDKALGIFKRIHETLPNLRLLVYNPGYIKGEVIINPGVLYYGPTAARNVWHNIRNSLCVFYPSEFKETFGLVAAEANALGVPLVGYRAGALPEIVNGDDQLLGINDENAVCTLVEKWYNESPPDTYGRIEFHTPNVVNHWLKIFAGGRP